MTWQNLSSDVADMFDILRDVPETGPMFSPGGGFQRDVAYGALDEEERRVQIARVTAWKRANRERVNAQNRGYRHSPEGKAKRAAWEKLRCARLKLARAEARAKKAKEAMQ